MALCTELAPMAMLLLKALLDQLASIFFSASPEAWLWSRLICTYTCSSANFSWMMLFSSGSS
jgi:hypothetical protein